MAVSVRINGTNGDDFLRGNMRDNIIFAWDGNDDVRGGDGRDTIFGGNGDDRLFGGHGNDRLFGEAGDDLIYGQAGNDTIFGGDGDDILDGGSGHDTIFGGTGQNVISGGIGNDRIFLQSGVNAAFGANGDDRISGSDGIDAIFGGAGRDVIHTGDGADFDIAAGGAGDDILNTGTGAGAHIGGAGRDTFRIDAGILSNGAVDQILAVDFNAAEDRLVIDQAVIAAATSISDIDLDLAPILAIVAGSGLLGAELAALRAQVNDGRALERDIGFLTTFTPDQNGQILVDAAQVTLNTGDTIIALGVTAADLTALLTA
jgi:Ca2+-binding RTX toxin-like protein